jgi:hypothetical protein
VSVFGREGEKDPRCLLIALNIGAKAQIVFAEHLDESGDLSDVLFDNIACYFPITFSPPPDDPFGITPEALVSALEDCLCAGQMNVVKHTVSFAINQVESDSAVSRLHALNLLLRVVRVHGHAALRSVGVLAVLGDLLYEVILKEASTSNLVPAALTLVGEISSSIGQDMYEKFLGDWKEFGFTLLQKVRKEIDNGVDSLQANGAIRIAFVIGNANSSCYSIMAATILPVLLSNIAVTKQRHRSALLKALEYFNRDIQVLPSVDESASFTTNGFRMLCQIINLSLGPVRSVSDEKAHSLTSRHIDASHLQELQPLSQNQRREIFDAVLGFLAPFDVDAMKPVLGAEPEAEASDSLSSTDEGASSRLSKFVPKADTISVISESIETMRVVLIGSSATDFDAERLEQCVISVTDIFLFGEQCLWMGKGVCPVICSGAAIHSNLDLIRKACLTFFRSLASQSVYLDVVSKHCITKILETSDQSMESYQIISTIISGSKGLALIQTFAPLLHTQLAATFLAIEACGDEALFPHLADAESVLIACESLLQVDPYADQSINSVLRADVLGHVVDNETKASFLVSLNAADADSSSIFFKISETIVGHSARLLSRNSHNRSDKAQQSILSIQMYFQSFLRRVVFALSRKLDLQTRFCVRFVDLVVRHSHPDRESGRVGASYAVPLMTTLLMNMDRQSPVFAGPIGATDVVRFGASLSLCFLGQEGADASHWLETTGSRAKEKVDLSWALFGPAKLLAVIVNKVRESRRYPSSLAFLSLQPLYANEI